ncbi:MAG: hypothetical protein JNM34_09455 [Chthonomonadaceae bacterium]|nr:hypothetical protein [Chthonomonadaceae bacterium]
MNSILMSVQRIGVNGSVHLRWSLAIDVCVEPLTKFNGLNRNTFGSNSVNFRVSETDL